MEDQIAQNGEGKVSTYVPFRNGLDAKVPLQALP